MYRLHQLGSVLRHGDRVGDVVGRRLDRQPEVLVAGAVAGGMERGDDRRRVQQHRGLRRARDERLVEVQHVELLVAERAHGAQRARRRRAPAEPSNRWPTSAGCCRAASRTWPAAGRRTARAPGPRCPSCGARGTGPSPGPARRPGPTGCTDRPSRPAAAGAGRSRPVSPRFPIRPRPGTLRPRTYGATYAPEMTDDHLPCPHCR